MAKYGIEETKSLKFARIVHAIIPYIFTSLFGTFLWSLTYICLYFYKELLLCHIKTNIKFEGKSYLLNLKEYKQYLPRILIFNLILIILWVITLLMKNDWKFYIIKSGFFFFVIIYITGWSIYYKNNSINNSFFEDFYTIWNYIRSNSNNELCNNNNDKVKKKIE